MQQVFCCMVQTCRIGLMHTCVSIIIAAKLLHLWWGNVWWAPCFKTDTHQPSTHICSSFIAAKLTCINLGYTSAAVTCSTFDAWLLQYLTHGNWFVQQNCCTNDAAMYGRPLCSSFVAQTNYHVWCFASAMHQKCCMYLFQMCILGWCATVLLQ